VHAPESAALIEKEQSRSRWDEGSRCEAGDELSLSALSLLAVGLVDVLPGPPTRAAGHGLSASARAELRLRFRRALSVEVGGEQRLAVWRPPDAGGAELGADNGKGVGGELRPRFDGALGGAGELAGAGRSQCRRSASAVLAAGMMKAIATTSQLRTAPPRYALVND